MVYSPFSVSLLTASALQIEAGRDLRVSRRGMLRTTLAVQAGKAAALASKWSGRGSGGMIGGKVALRLDPQVLPNIARNVRSMVVSGTNGKSTTTRMVYQALQSLGQVATNLNGDNLTSGVTTSLMFAKQAKLAALEVDEMHVPEVVAGVKPEVILLLNLSRDQLDRVGEIGSVEKALRKAINANPQATVIANCDDPLIVCAAADAPKVVWVSVGASWNKDSVAYPRGGQVVHDAEGWHLVPTAAGEKLPALAARPKPDWVLSHINLCSQQAVSEAQLLAPDGSVHSLRLQVPGRGNLGNAAQAVAAAVAMGVPVETAVQAVSTVREVAGRYSQHDINGRIARLFLAKNPAGWQDALTMIDPTVEQIVIGVNGQVPDGQDLSWLWDVDFAPLLSPKRKIVACGERGADLAVCLTYAGIECELVDTPLEALTRLAPGRVDMLLNYTVLRDFKLVLESLPTITQNQKENIND